MKLFIVEQKGLEIIKYARVNNTIADNGRYYIALYEGKELRKSGAATFLSKKGLETILCTDIFDSENEAVVVLKKWIKKQNKPKDNILQISEGIKPGYAESAKEFLNGRSTSQKMHGHIENTDSNIIVLERDGNFNVKKKAKIIKIDLGYYILINEAGSTSKIVQKDGSISERNIEIMYFKTDNDAYVYVMGMERKSEKWNNSDGNVNKIVETCIKEAEKKLKLPKINTNDITDFDLNEF